MRAQGAEPGGFWRRSIFRARLLPPCGILKMRHQAIEANFSALSTVVPGILDVRKAIVERHACDFGSD